VSKIVINPFTGQPDIVGTSGGTPPTEGGYNAIRTTVLQGDVDAGYLTLSASPTEPASTVILIKGAPNQYYGDDFSISGNQLVFEDGTDNDGLAFLLEAGDKITILYK
jgi:hypothetical protein